jgi:acylphosphatase
LRKIRSVVRNRVVIHGRVQGVFFRDSLGRLAGRHGVSGWARNTSEGTVEAVFEGEPAALDRLVSFAHVGPPDAHVDRVEVYDEEPEGLSGFSIR